MDFRVKDEYRNCGFLRVSLRCALGGIFVGILIWSSIFLSIPTFDPRSRTSSVYNETHQSDDYHRHSAKNNSTILDVSTSIINMSNDNIIVPKLAFVFLVASNVIAPQIWAKFFENANKDLYNIYVHTTNDIISNISEKDLNNPNLFFLKPSMVINKRIQTFWGKFSAIERYKDIRIL